MSFFKLWKALSLFSFLVLCVHANSSEPLAVQSNLGTDTATSVPDGTDGGLNLAASWTTLPGQSDNDYSNPAEVFLASSENSPVDCSGSSMRSRRRLSKGKRDTNIICPWEQPSSDLSSPAGQQPAPASQLDTTGTSSSGTGRTKNPAKNRGGSRGKEQNNQIVPTKPLMGEPNLELCHELYPIPVCHRPFFGSIHEETPEVWSLIPCRGLYSADCTASLEELWCCVKTKPRIEGDITSLAFPLESAPYPLEGISCKYIKGNFEGQ